MASETHARFLREASQIAGISGPEPWDDISERRQEQWLAMAEELPKTGALLLDPEAVAALRTVLDVCDDNDHRPAFKAIRSDRDRLRAAIGTPTVPVCPRCGERTFESPRTGRTCVDDACGWRERE